jgi:hypothetical protein
MTVDDYLNNENRLFNEMAFGTLVYVLQIPVLIDAAWRYFPLPIRQACK